MNDRNHIKATGYNGVPSGFEHCIDTSCPGAAFAGQPDKVKMCWSVHAEVNAFMQLSDFHEATVAYMSTTPCSECAKLFASSSVRKIIALEQYNDPMALKILAIAGIEIEIRSIDEENN